ncbi:hypothetical protein Tsubulata_046511 [Turnera subulata]|uniref:Uncharacterized protein n=1 Tax=Turnera subulata TaxID=218843 RepID=A0A9Q0J1S6_9ROSI|nr:hypothetical protein Tsubulata_046511 [Turnera subulata]
MSSTNFSSSSSSSSSDSLQSTAHTNPWHAPTIEFPAPPPMHHHPLIRPLQVWGYPAAMAPPMHHQPFTPLHVWGSPPPPPPAWHPGGVDAAIADVLSNPRLRPLGLKPPSGS